MTRFSLPDVEPTDPYSRRVLQAAHAALGFTPNLHRLMAINPKVLAGWVELQTNLTQTLDLKTRDAIALAVTEVNDCSYCRLGHAYGAAVLSRLSAEEIERNRRGESEDPKRAAAAHFAHRVVEARGKVSVQDFDAVRDAGWSEAEVIAIVALASQYTMTNFLNNVADTTPDFPRVTAVSESSEPGTRKH